MSCLPLLNSTLWTPLVQSPVWKGLCTRWGISSSQTVDNTLRKIAKDGINLLGLVEAEGGYRYISTLWLQSGIPYQNLEQFAQLLQELANEYTWNNLAQDSVENLSKIILYLYNRKYPQGGTLAHLLKYPEPISGKIIRGIAKIAGELENRQIDCTVLQDEQQRDNFLKSLAIDDEFFLRDWEAIVKILTPQGRNREIKIIDKQVKDISLYIESQSQKIDEPRLIGIKLNSRTSSYLETPTLWLPPCNQLLQVELKIRDNNSNFEICSYKYTSVINLKWVEISLRKWIDKVGNYTISIDRMNWYGKFTVTPKYSISYITELSEPQVSIDNRIIATDNLPVSYQTSYEFNAQVIKISGLWSLEQVILILNHGGNENIERRIQADRDGNLKISVSEFSEYWSDLSTYYSLSYQRDGENPQSLIEAKLAINNLDWLWVDRELVISGFKPDYPYDLSCWNLLLPDREAVKLPLPLAKIELDTINTPLNLETGIYYIRLLNGREQVEATIGFYCTGGQNDLPEAGLGNEDLENYCYTILGNEPIPDFQNAVERLAVSFDAEIVISAIDSLRTPDLHLLPEWLDRNGLIEKLYLLLELN